MPNNPARPLIEGRNLYKIFQLADHEVYGLNDVSLTIPQGEFVAIVGPSGSGKSTLLYVLGGLDRPNAGLLRIAGQRVDTLDSAGLAQFRRERIGFVFQAFHLVPTITALENVALPGVFARLPQADRLARAEQLLSMLGLGERFDHLPRQLSGGQQQRVAIARALFNDPPIIMADEPTGALDSQTGYLVLKMLRTLCKQRHKTIIVVTHDPLIAQHADRVLLLSDGKIVREERHIHY